jgi:hypothetical protein
LRVRRTKDRDSCTAGRTGRDSKSGGSVAKENVEKQQLEQ